MIIKLQNWIFLFLGLSVYSFSAQGLENSQTLLNEVIAQSQSPHAFDWRSERVSLEMSKVIINERNNFLSGGFAVGARKTFEGRYLGIVGFRSIKTEATASSEMLAKTPFTQAAQPSRLELFAVAGLPILAGRSFSIFSDWLPDFEHVLYIKLGGHYNFFNDALKIKSQPSDILPGQRNIVYHEVLNAGLRLQMSLFHSASVFLDYDYYYPGAHYDRDLPEWLSLGGGFSWSF